MAKIKYLLLLLIPLAVSSCGNKGNIKIKGSFSGLNEKMVYLDKITIENIYPIDSVLTDDKGRFKFIVKPDNSNPAFYNLRTGERAFTLLLSPGEKIKVRSLGNYARNYLIEGSPGSALIKDLNIAMTRSFMALDSLSRIFSGIDNYPPDVRRRVQDEYSSVYIKQKQDMIRFVVNNSNSLAAIYALYQRLPNGEGMFSKDDILYFELVYDSLNKLYPDSPNVLSLKKDIDRIQNLSNLSHLLSEAMISGISFPEIELPDMYGNKIKLTEVTPGKIVLLDFWAAEMPNSVFHNAELMEIYSEFFDKDFEIYKVSLDISKSAWVKAVQDQKLPWVSVCDFLSGNSPAAHSYNVTELPTNFLIDKQGSIAGRDIPLDKLPGRLRELISQ